MSAEDDRRVELGPPAAVHVALPMLAERVSVGRDVPGVSRPSVRKALKRLLHANDGELAKRMAKRLCDLTESSDDRVALQAIALIIENVDGKVPQKSSLEVTVAETRRVILSQVPPDFAQRRLDMERFEAQVRADEVGEPQASTAPASADLEGAAACPN